MLTHLNGNSLYGKSLYANYDLNNCITKRYYCTPSTNNVSSLINRPNVIAGEIGVLWFPFNSDNGYGVQIAISTNGNQIWIHIRTKTSSGFSDWNLIYEHA